MIENLNDLISVAVLIAILAYASYLIIRAFSYHRLTKHIRDEQKYYRDWEDEEK